jgi:hypothetical protein
VAAHFFFSTTFSSATPFHLFRKDDHGHKPDMKFSGARRYKHRRSVSFGGFEGTPFDEPFQTLSLAPTLEQHEHEHEHEQQLHEESPVNAPPPPPPPPVASRPTHRRNASWGGASSAKVPYDVSSVPVVRPRPRSYSDLERDQDEEGWKRNQLTAMALAMGGPGFPNSSLQPNQASDTVNRFQPLLLEYLKMNGSVDDTASFQDFFGHDSGLYDWTLLKVAVSIFVNAPNCMLVLLEHGASPLLLDSSGRNVITEALATARYGETGPYEILKSRVAAHVWTNAKLCDVTEAMFIKLRRGKMGTTPQQTRQEFVQMREQGFVVHSKIYPPDDIENHFARMHLMNLKELQSRSSLPESGDASCLKVLPQVIADPTLATRRRVLFISHRWLQSSHPDDDEHRKFHAIVQAGLSYCEIHQTDHADCFLWVDYCCIRQSNPDLKTRGIQALPFYILLADAFVVIEHESYMTRAWCLLEMLLGSFMPTKTRGYYLYKLDESGRLREMTPSMSDLCLLRPQDGGVTDPADMEYIRALTWFAEAHLYRWL